MAWARNLFDVKGFEIFPWSKNFEIRNEKIDNQHKRLVGLLNELGKLLIDDSRIKIEETITQLFEYAEYHFSDEEKYWRQFFRDSSILTEHKNQHDSFLPKVKEIQNQSNNSDTIEEVGSLIHFLIKWLAFHIIDSDKRMSLMVEALKTGASEKDAENFANKEMSCYYNAFINTLLMMYEELSLNAIYLIHEHRARLKAESKLIILNNKLESLAVTDELTGLYNRRYFNTIFEKEYLRSRRERVIFNLFMFDVDSFKTYNDKYGHPEGDKVLKIIGNTLNDSCRRPEDYAFRIGGEEFAIITTGLEPESAIAYADKIRTTVMSLNIKNICSGFSNVLTVSCGFICRVPSMEDSLTELYKSADVKLYEAKKAGKNQIKYQA